MTPLVTHLLSPSAMDVIVSRFRRGEKGIGDILHVALQSCIIEKNVIQDSPKKPVHHRYKSHSSFLSSDTAVSIQPGVDPEALDTWKTILAEIDEMISHSLKKEIQSANTELLGDPTEPPEEAWTALGQIMAGSDHNERMFGMRWLQMYFLTLLEDRLHEDRSHMVHPSPHDVTLGFTCVCSRSCLRRPVTTQRSKMSIRSRGQMICTRFCISG